MGEVKSTLQALALQMQEQSTSIAQQMQQQSLVLSELSKQIGQKVNENSNESEKSMDDYYESRFSGKKVKLPVFEGDDPVAWITRAEIYFDVQNTSEEMRVKLARLSMEGATIHWFNLLMETEDQLTWEKLKKSLIARYGGRRLENPFEELSTLKQTGSVEEFVEAFELLSSQVGRLPEEQYLGYFMSGLKQPIRRRVRTLNPQNRMQMMRMAKDVEEELKEEDDDGDRAYGKKLLGRSEPSGLGSKFRSGFNPAQKEMSRSTNSGWANPSRKTGSVGSNSKSTSSLSSTGKKGEYDRRSGGSEKWKGVRNEEMEERRAKGLCFKCGGKYHPTLHKCPERALRLLILGEGETMNDDGEIVAMEAEGSEEEEDQEAECNLIGILGKMGEYQTMKIEGKLANVTVEVLIDSGASHSFISPKLTMALGLTVTPTTVRSIKLGDGHRVMSEGVCRGVRIALGTQNFVIDALVLELGGLDVVLGVSWLSTLGKVVMDWKDLSMQFWHNDEMVTLQGQSGRQLQQGFLNSFLEDRKREFSNEWWWSPNVKIEGGKAQINKGIAEVLGSFPQIFQEQITLPPEREQVHQINLLPNHGPVNVRPYKYPHHQKEEIEKQVAELLQAGVIRPSMSAFSSPVILVKKKDHSWRMCVDYRALNKATVPDKYPIPIVDELLDELYGATVFSKIDLKSGYHQIRVHEDDVHKTAFRTHNGHYEYLVMPFGLMNAPATFQSTMNHIFRPFLRKFVLVFFDDILVYSNSEQEHLTHLKQVLTVLMKHCFVANRSKCKFGRLQVDYLGHIISGEGVSVDPEKIKCILEWPEPKNVKEVRGFLGLTGYYRKFVKDYGKIARPLTDLTKKDNFLWGETAREAFNQLKKIMTTSPVLVLPNFSIPFEVECDAAGRGIGAVLMQNKQPIAYFSKALSDNNLAKSVYEKELMALVLSIQHWRHYLLGKEFVVYTDHKSLKHFLQQRISSPDQQCWLAKLLGYQFEVKYKPGPENKAADALSRCYDEGELTALKSGPTWVDSKQLLQEVKQDASVQKIIAEVELNPSAKPGFSVQQGVLLYQGRLVLGKNSPSIHALLKEFHETPMGGHSGYLRNI